MDAIKAAFVMIATILVISCISPSATSREPSGQLAVAAYSFAYPVGKTETVTQVKDNKDEWYNALDFGVNDHLGEDWNKNSGGNTDCGESVYAIADGVISYAGDSGPGWGNVLIITHLLRDGSKVQSLYGHLQEILVKDGSVNKRQLIGRVGNANGKYYCHLHLEIRTEACPKWNVAGDGYSTERKGWLDPSDLIDEQRRLQPN